MLNIPLVLVSFSRIVLRGKVFVLSYSKNDPVMKPIKILGILLGMTLTFGGSSVFVRPVFAIASTERMNTESLFERGTEKINRGDYQSAIADLDRVIELDPNYIEAYCSRGMAHFGLGNMERAIAQFDLALQVAPRHADALVTVHSPVRKSKGKWNTAQSPCPFINY